MPARRVVIFQHIAKCSPPLLTLTIRPGGQTVGGRTDPMDSFDMIHDTPHNIPRYIHTVVLGISFGYYRIRTTPAVRKTR
jgi:hypothetical protein